MQQVYLNPFLTIQERHSETFMAVTSDSDRIMRIHDSSHPLYGVKKREDFHGRTSRLSKTDFETLLAGNFISFRPFDRNAMLDKIYREKDSEESFFLAIFPTLNCNNACVYCYQKHLNQPRMDASDYQALYRLILNKIGEGVTHISISLMGGEPTLENDMVLPFLQQCLKICDNSDVEFTASMTTNGRIMDVEKYKAAGINLYQITLDGPQDIHDRLRPGIHGEKTFDAILTGLNKLAEAGGEKFNCAVRINHTTESIKEDAIHSYLSLLSGYFKEDRRFEIFHRIASDLGGDIDDSVLIPRDQRNAVLERINNRTRDYNLFTKNDMFQPNSRVCYAAQKDAFTVLPGRRIVKCTVAIDEKYNHIGMLSSNGIPQFNDHLDLWVSDDVKNRRCNSCNVAPICQSRSCPVERIRTGKNPCPDVKFDTSFLIRKMQASSLL